MVGVCVNYILYEEKVNLDASIFFILNLQDETALFFLQSKVIIR